MEIKIEEMMEARKKRFIKEVKSVYGNDVEVAKNTTIQYHEELKYFYGCFGIHRGDKELCFMCDEHDVNNPYALRFYLDNSNDNKDYILKFKKGA